MLCLERGELSECVEVIHALLHRVGTHEIVPKRMSPILTSSIGRPGSWSVVKRFANVWLCSKITQHLYEIGLRCPVSNYTEALMENMHSLFSNLLLFCGYMQSIHLKESVNP
jgi:hypothetical protein